MRETGFGDEGGRMGNDREASRCFEESSRYEKDVDTGSWDQNAREASLTRCPIFVSLLRSQYGHRAVVQTRYTIDRFSHLGTDRSHYPALASQLPSPSFTSPAPT
jgi:hypothetical protein